MGKRKLNASVHEISPGPDSQVWEEKPSRHVSRLHLVLVLPGGLCPSDALLVGMKAEVTCAVDPSANFHSLTFCDATLFVIEAPSNAGSCLTLGAESMHVLCSQVL